jgi:hypothetical protein
MPSSSKRSPVHKLGQMPVFYKGIPDVLCPVFSGLVDIKLSGEVKSKR